VNDIKQDKQGTSRVRTPGRSAAAEAGIAASLGVLAGLFGFAPWLMTGAQLPLQNLWATAVLPEDMPVALLPLSQYQSTTILALLTVGGALAGLSIRLQRPAHRGPAVGGATMGLLVVQVAATVQAFIVLGDGLGRGTLASVYFAGLLAGTVAAMAASVGALLMIAAKSRAVTALGTGLMAVPAASWLAATAGYAAGPGGVPVPITMAWRWLPAILVGLALAWCGLKPASRLWIWAANLALLWIVPAVFTAINSVLGTRVLAGNMPEMLAMGGDVLGAALGPAGGAGPLVLVALAIGLGGAGLQQVRRRKATSPA
jgi:hypothetical protein